MDRYTTTSGNIDIKHLGHGSVMIISDDKVIIIDPYSAVCDYCALPKADLILVTHHHSDHLDTSAIANASKSDTYIITSERAAVQLPQAATISNGERIELRNISIHAIAAYNMTNKRASGEPYHIKGEGNGYIIEINGLRIYVAGDTELIPEMYELGSIDIAFLPKMSPYTMDEAMFVKAARVIHPRILYPYHYDNADHRDLQSRLEFTQIR